MLILLFQDQLKANPLRLTPQEMCPGHAVLYFIPPVSLECPVFGQCDLVCAVLSCFVLYDCWMICGGFLCPAFVADSSRRLTVTDFLEQACVCDAWVLPCPPTPHPEWVCGNNNSDITVSSQTGTLTCDSTLQIPDQCWSILVDIQDSYNERWVGPNGR